MPGLPPGPSAGRFAQGAAFHRDPLRFLRENRERFGDVFTINVAFAGPMVVVADREAAGRVVRADPQLGRGGEARRRLLGMISPDSILGADAAAHTEARGSLEPAFTPAAVSGLGDEMRVIAARHAASWPRGRPFRVLPRMRALLDEIFVRLMLGVRDEQRVADLTRAIGRMIHTPGNPPLPPPGDGNGLAGALAGRIFERRKEPAARLLATEIDERRAAGDDRHDAIGCSLRALPTLSTAEHVDRLIPLLMAGQEPPAAAHTWLLDRIGREPGAAERFRDGEPGDPYLRAFVRETLRITPAVHSVVRVLTGPLAVPGGELPTGVAANAPIALIHRDAAVFPDPDEFRPERFLPDPGVDGPDFPFGGAARQCLGMWLAAEEFGHVTAAILRAVRLRPVLPRPERMVVRGTVLVPQRSGLAIARG